VDIVTSRKRIGLLIPSTNTAFEADFQLVSQDRTTTHSQRLWLTNDAEGAAGMDGMNDELEQAARYLATARVDIMTYGCTTGSFYRGVGWDRQITDLVRRVAGVPAVSTSPSVVQALRAIGAKKVSVATPYPDWNNRLLARYLEAEGFTVVNIEGEPRAAASGNQGINEFEPEDVISFAAAVCRADADVLFCSCTAWRAFEAVPELERRTGRPVVTSNQASIWATYLALGLEPPSGHGALFDHPAPQVTVAL
jgi:maleate cis-trans isomerase